MHAPRGDTRSANDADAPVHARDLRLVREILAGSEPAWHAFIVRYSGLITAVIRRQLSGSRIDEICTLRAEVLAALYRGRLRSYEGRAALSTWLVPFVRGVVVDDVRRRLGGRQLHRRLRSLPPFERRVFQLHFVDGATVGTVTELLGHEDASIDRDAVLRAIHDIERRVGSRHARRLRYELHARSVGVTSGRLLEYLDHVRSESELASAMQMPEFALMEREARRLLQDVQNILSRLPDADRNLLAMRFERGWTAKRIAETLGLDGQRSAYTMIDRVLRGIRRVLEGGTLRRSTVPAQTANHEVASPPGARARPREVP